MSRTLSYMSGAIKRLFSLVWTASLRRLRPEDERRADPITASGRRQGLEVAGRDGTLPPCTPARRPVVPPAPGHRSCLRRRKPGQTRWMEMSYGRQTPGSCDRVYRHPVMDQQRSPATEAGIIEGDFEKRPSPLRKVHGVIVGLKRCSSTCSEWYAFPLERIGPPGRASQAGPDRPRVLIKARARQPPTRRRWAARPVTAQSELLCPFHRTAQNPRIRTESIDWGGSNVRPALSLGGSRNSGQLSDLAILTALPSDGIRSRLNVLVGSGVSRR